MREMVAVPRYKRFRALGLCGQCGHRPPEEGSTRCAECAERKRQYANAGRAYRISKGLCRDCGVELTDTRFVRCEKCRRTHSADVAEWRQQAPSYTKDYFKGIHLEALMKYSSTDPPSCGCCGESILLFLTIDHINNDGAEHRRNTKGASGKNLAWWLRKNGWPTGFQVLCFNCNCGKARNNGVCPHHGTGNGQDSISPHA